MEMESYIYLRCVDRLLVGAEEELVVMFLAGTNNIEK